MRQNAGDNTTKPLTRFVGPGYERFDADGKSYFKYSDGKYHRANNISLIATSKLYTSQELADYRNQLAQKQAAQSSNISTDSARAKASIQLNKEVQAERAAAAKQNKTLLDQADNLVAVMMGAKNSFNSDNSASSVTYKEARADLEKLLAKVKDTNGKSGAQDESEYKTIQKLIASYPKSIDKTHSTGTENNNITGAASVLIAHAMTYSDKMKKLASGKGIEDVVDGNTSNDEMKQYESALAAYKKDVAQLNKLGVTKLDKELEKYTGWATSKKYTTGTGGSNGATGNGNSQGQPSSSQDPDKTKGSTKTSTAPSKSTSAPKTSSSKTSSEKSNSGANSSDNTSTDKQNGSNSAKNNKNSKQKETTQNSAAQTSAGGAASSGQSSGDGSSSSQSSQPSANTAKANNSAVADKLNDDTDGQVYVLGRFEKAFGADGANQYRKAVNAMLASEPSNIKIVDNKAGGNFSVKVKDSHHKWTGATDVVTASLSKHIDFTGADTQTRQDSLTKLGTDGSALERHILARYDKAFGAADGRARMYAATDAALAANGANVKEFGTRGQAGYFVAIKDSKGKWSSRGDLVIAELSKYDGATASTTDQKAVLLNASGSGLGTTVVKDFNAVYGDAETAQKAFYASIDAYAKAKPGSIREFGTRGTPGFYVEIKTKDGWVGNTDKVTDALAKYAPSKKEAAKLAAIGGAAATTSPTTTPTNNQPAAKPDQHDPDKDAITNKYDVWNNTSGVPSSVNSKSELNDARDKLTKQIAAARAANNGSLDDDIIALEGNLAEVNNRLGALDVNLPDSDKDQIANKYDLWDNTNGVPKSINTLKELNAAKEKLTAKIAAAQAENKNWLSDDIAALQSNLNDVNNKIAAKTMPAGISGTTQAGPAPISGQVPAPLTAPAASPNADSGIIPPHINTPPETSKELKDSDSDGIANKYDVWEDKAGIPEKINTRDELEAAQKKLTEKIAAASAAGAASDVAGLQANLDEVNKKYADRIDPDGDNIRNKYDLWNNAVGVPDKVNSLKELNNAKADLEGMISKAQATGDASLSDDIVGLQSNLNEVNVRISHKTMASGNSEVANTGAANSGPSVPISAHVAPAPAPVVPAPAPAPSEASATNAEILAAADRNGTGKLSANEMAKFKAIADANSSGVVTSAEAQAFNLLDTNDNKEIGKKELQAYRNIDADSSGSISQAEVNLALQIKKNDTQSKRTKDLAQAYLGRSAEIATGNDTVDKAAAMIVSQNKTESSLDD